MPDAAASEFARRAPWRRRLSRSVRRRWTAYWSRLRRGDRGPTVEAAFDALARALPILGPPPHPARAAPCVLTLGRAAATAARFGQLDLASAWCLDLVGAQSSEGSFPDGAGQPSRLHTAQALRGLTTLHEARSQADRWQVSGSSLNLGALTDAIRRSALYLAGQLDPSGLPLRREPPAGSIDRWGPPSLSLCWLPPLCSAARLFDEPVWEQLARRSLRRQLNAADVTRWNAPTTWWGYAVEALVELGELALARRALRHPAACQRAGGDVPALPGQRRVSAQGLAILSSAWRRLGGADEQAHADRALAALRRRQFEHGALPAMWDADSRPKPQAECPLTAALYLEAVYHQVRGSFTSLGSLDSGSLHSSAEDFPAEIDGDDGRLAAVLAWCQTLGPRSRILDVGCGKGRFLRHLREQVPQATLVGVDLSAAALARLPQGAIGRQGDLLRIPASDGEFDGAICIEALEHALLPSRAVAEFCRVVRPGGGMLIIDKHRAHQPLSDHEPWERWFEPQEVAGWLGVLGDRVETRPLAHGRDRRPTGLFWCWTAVRRADESRREAA